MSPIPIGMLTSAGKAGIQWFIAANTSFPQSNHWLNENSYVTTTNNILEKFDAGGNLVAAYTYTGNNGIGTVWYDRTNEAIYINSSNSSTYYLTKLDLDLDVVWSRSANVSAGGVSQIKTNSAGRIFYGINWTQGGTTNQDAGIWHINSDATDSRFLFASQGAPYNRESWNDIVFDNAGNTYGLGRWSTDNTNNYRYHIAKWDNSGNWQWSYYSDQTNTTQHWISNGAFDSQGNLYIATPFGFESRLIKISLSGGTPSIVWQRALYQASPNTTDRGRDPSVVIDANDDVYMTYMYGDGVFITKYDSSGTIVWSRRIYLPASGNDYIKLTYASEEHLVGSWWFGFVDDGFIFSLPLDGSFTGTYSFDGQSILIDTASAAYTDPVTTITSFTPQNRSNNALTATPVSVTRSATTDNWTLIGI